jgi:hypothetical protein
MLNAVFFGSRLPERPLLRSFLNPLHRPLPLPLLRRPVLSPARPRGSPPY